LSQNSSLEKLLANLDPAFRMSCPKCGSKNVHISSERSVWDPGTPDYTFVCYTCGLRKYTERVIYELVRELFADWKASGKAREEEAKMLAEKKAQEEELKRRAKEYMHLQRKREEEERQREAAEHQKKQLEWLEGMAKRTAEPPPPSPAKTFQETPEEPNKQGREDLDTVPCTGGSSEGYAQSQMEEPLETSEERSKRLKRERGARYRMNKRLAISASEEVLRATYELAPQSAEKFVKCAYVSCTEQARGTSKYCSRNCSNRNARDRERERAVEQRASR